jgi:hypothetical protein
MLPGPELAHVSIHVCNSAKCCQSENEAIDFHFDPNLPYIFGSEFVLFLPQFRNCGSFLTLNFVLPILRAHLSDRISFSSRQVGGDLVDLTSGSRVFHSLNVPYESRENF